MIQAITIEREFGCGASEIASQVASRLGWSLWDQQLTQEIARLTDSTPQALEQREWRTDPLRPPSFWATSLTPAATERTWR
jgi:hypothetical protein